VKEHIIDVLDIDIRPDGDDEPYAEFLTREDRFNRLAPFLM